MKTDRVDLIAIADLLLAGRGVPVMFGDEPLLELQAWVAHRRRRVEVRTATKTQLVGQLDRVFPGLGVAICDVLGSKIGRLVAACFSDPALVRPAPSGSASTPPAEACGSADLWRPGWWPPPATQYAPRALRWLATCWPPTWLCSRTSKGVGAENLGSVSLTCGALSG